MSEINQEQSVLKWGGISGLLGSMLFFGVVAFVAVYLPPDPTDLSKWVTRFAEIKTLRVIENFIYLFALILQVPLFLALFFTLRKSSLAAALFGTTLGIIGLISMIVSATPHVAHASLSQIYLNPSNQPANLNILAYLWQGTWGVFNAMLYVGFFIVPLGLLLISKGLFRSPNFGAGQSLIITLLSLCGIGSAIYQIAFPASIAGVASFFACVFSFLFLSIKVYRLSKA